MKRRHEENESSSSTSASAEDTHPKAKTKARAKRAKRERRADTYVTPHQVLASVMKQYSIDSGGVRYAIVQPESATSTDIYFARADSVMHIGEGSAPGCPTKSPKFNTVDGVRYTALDAVMHGLSGRSVKFLFNGFTNVYDMQQQ